MISVGVLDLVTMDETYTVDLIGRQGAAGAYTVLASITPTAVGVYTKAVPGPINDSLNISLDVAGTTPSIEFGAFFIATEIQYGPDIETVVTA